MFYKASASKCMQALKAARKLNKACDAMQDSPTRKVTSSFNTARVHSNAGAMQWNSMRCYLILAHWGFVRMHVGKVIHLTCTAWSYGFELRTQLHKGNQSCW